MSRIGKKKITVPSAVKVAVGAGGVVKVEGPKGKLEWALPAAISASVEGEEITVTRGNETRQVKALHGLSRALLANMVTGVSAGFKRELEIQGVGFKAALKGDKLDLALGYSHPILHTIPAGIKVTVTDQTKLKIEGVDKQLVGQVTSEIRAYYPPEPYKGKGVRLVGEYAERVRRKEGKTVA